MKAPAETVGSDRSIHIHYWCAPAPHVTAELWVSVRSGSVEIGDQWS